MKRSTMANGFSLQPDTSFATMQELRMVGAVALAGVVAIFALLV